MAWLDPSIITKWKKLYLDVSIDHGASYGDTLVWTETTRPHMGEREVEIQDDLDKPKFYKEFADLLNPPHPGSHDPPGPIAMTRHQRALKLNSTHRRRALPRVAPACPERSRSVAAIFGSCGFECQSQPTLRHALDDYPVHLSFCLP